MTRITVINPNTSAELTATITAAAQAVAGAGVTVTGVNPAVGVPSVESHAEEAIAAVGVVEQVRPNQDNTDAFVIACFGDTGVAAAREVATCPVVGMTEAALQTACLVAHRFVVITLPARTIAHSDRVVRALGLEHRCSVIAVDVPVAELVDGSTHLLDAFVEAARPPSTPTRPRPSSSAAPAWPTSSARSRRHSVCPSSTVSPRASASPPDWWRWG